MQRCDWVSQDPLYIAYHDNEWGVPETDSRKLFEMICLEGQQAGLSWITVLKKRENYRACFHQFDPVRIAAMQEEEVERLLQNTGIIRHRGKIQAIISNARAWLAMEQNGESFADFVWSFVDGQPQITQAASLDKIPTSTPASDALAKALKKRGFKFVGTTICLCPSLYRRTLLARERSNCTRRLFTRRANLGMGGKWTTERLRQRTGSPFCRGAVCRPRRVKTGHWQSASGICPATFSSAEP